MARAAQRSRDKPGGAPVPPAVRQLYESTYGHDLSGVRVHQNGVAESIGAVAVARGSDLHFASGHYQPHTDAGRALIGHELAHTVQQRRAGKPGSGLDRDAGREREADDAAAAALAGRSAAIAGVATGAQARFGPYRSPVGSEDSARESRELVESNDKSRAANLLAALEDSRVSRHKKFDNVCMWLMGSDIGSLKSRFRKLLFKRSQTRPSRTDPRPSYQDLPAAFRFHFADADGKYRYLCACLKTGYPPLGQQLRLALGLVVHGRKDSKRVVELFESLDVVEAVRVWTALQPQLKSRLEAKWYKRIEAFAGMSKNTIATADLAFVLAHSRSPDKRYEPKTPGQRKLVRQDDAIRRLRKQLATTSKSGDTSKSGGKPKSGDTSKPDGSSKGGTSRSTSRLKRALRKAKRRRDRLAQ